MADNVANSEQHREKAQARKKCVMGKKANTLKIVAIAGGITIGIIATLSIALYTYVHKSCEVFFSRVKDSFLIPGIREDFDPQDMVHIPNTDLWIFSGYMGNDLPSPIYVGTKDGAYKKLVIQQPDDALYKGHGAAVAINGNYLYLTSANGCYVLALNDVLNAADGDVIRAQGKRDLGIFPAFMTIDNNKLFIGEFYHPFFYDTPLSHHFTTPDGTANFALMYEYELDEQAPFGIGESPVRVYSIPENVQGFCVDAEGRFIFSTSFGVTPSHLLIYDPAKLVQSKYLSTFDTKAGEAPLYFVDEEALIEDVLAPPLAEGISLKDDLVYVPSEASANRYVFGKLYGADVAYGILNP